VTFAIRKLIAPGAITLVMLMALVGLGTWQVQRLAWKRDILARVAAAEAQGPMPLSDDAPPFARVTATGKFRHDLTARFGAFVQNSAMGTHLIVPLERENAPVVLVDRGWVPSLPTTALDQPEGTVTVVGFIHPPDKAGLLSAADDVAGRQFFTMDAAAIAASLGLKSVAPFILVTVGPAPVSRWPEPVTTLPRPPNNHLTYAIVWYGLAVSLIVVFIVWARKGTRA
jgi:surfeit locus 1 family protein